VWLIPASVIVHKRSKGNRLRSTPFGPKHYYNVRNRIVVKRAYTQLSSLGAALGAMFGIALWLCSPGKFKPAARRTLLGALSDGYADRLGPFPEHLRGSPAR